MTDDPTDMDKGSSAGEVETKLLVSISGERRTSAGIDIKDSDVEACDIAVLKTVPFYRAEEIQHDVEEFLKINTGKFSEIATSLLTSHPRVEEIATPIYIVTVLDGQSGRIEYVGKASSKTNRFAGGHAVAMKLHHPKYANSMKYISFAVLIISTAKPGRFPVEWISSDELRRKIIDHVEQALIWKFQPMLNTASKNREPID